MLAWGSHRTQVETIKAVETRAEGISDLETVANEISFHHVLQADDQLAASMHSKTKSFGAETTWNRRRWHSVVFASFLWLLIGTLIYYGYYIGQIKGMATLFLLEGVVGLWAINISFWLIHFKKTLLKNAGFHDRLQEEADNFVDDNGWRISTPTSSSNHMWGAFDRVIQTADHILVYRFGSSCLVAPKSAMSTKEFERLGVLCKANVRNSIVIR